MRNLRRNKRTLYLCQAYQDGKIRKYKAPIKIYENFVPTNSESDLVSLGMEYPMYLRIKTSMQEKNLFHPKDRLYVYKDIPAIHDELCENADYEVYKEPLQFINELEIMIKRLSDDNE